jgi:hypothetical protein
LALWVLATGSEWASLPDAETIEGVRKAIRGASAVRVTLDRGIRGVRSAVVDSSGVALVPGGHGIAESPPEPPVPWDRVRTIDVLPAGRPASAVGSVWGGFVVGTLVGLAAGIVVLELNPELRGELGAVVPMIGGPAAGGLVGTAIGAYSASRRHPADAGWMRVYTSAPSVAR